MIEATGLIKDYGARRAVDGLSFTVRPGIVTGFLGPRTGEVDDDASDSRPGCPDGGNAEPLAHPDSRASPALCARWTAASERTTSRRPAPVGVWVGVGVGVGVGVPGGPGSPATSPAMRSPAARITTTRTSSTGHTPRLWINGRLLGRLG